MSFAGLVQQVTAAHREAKPGPSTNSTKTLDDENLVRSGRQSNGDRALPLSPATIAPFAPDSPSTRTGPPRSLSYTYSLSSLSTPTRSRNNPDLMSPDGMPKTPLDNLDGFRSALDLDQLDRKGKRKESRTVDEGRSSMKWFHDSPREEKAGFDFDSTRYGRQTPPCITIQTPDGKPERTGSPNHPKSASTIDSGYKLESPLDRRTLNPRRTLPTSNDQAEARSGRVGNRWSMIRSLIPHIGSQDKDARTSGPSAVTSNKVNITDELITGGLSTLMLRLWFERDEKDHRRIPILFHRLRIRVSDSLHPMHKQKTVFRIECEYANGATRWVIYRTMRDFLSLHAHYQLSNVYKRNVEKIPEFPRHALPYLKFLKKEGREVGSANFALLQRESLENYLIELIRAVMFHPSSNRLAGFLEISALSISMAQSGGSQYKAGYLDIASEGVGGGFGRRSAGWRARKSSKWCAIRESYLVVMEEPGELNVWDVFLLDPDFEIERPKRYYRQGLHLLHVDGFVHSDKEADNTHISDDAERRSMIDSVTAKISKFFHAEDKRRADPDNTMLGQHEGSIHSLESEVSQAPPPMLDPSTNINPLISKEDEHPPEGKDYSEDVSKHTFYITNAQMRLRLFARTERQMLQWITAFEKVAASSHYTGKNRFDSFAPIRLNVAAQWLVDGRDYFWNLSRAILLAHESIYIHDWWLSPELLMRRPEKGKYRLDRLLERKAKEGVKIYIILYQEVSNRTTPTDSNYSKQRLMSLHPNVMVQRSPSHFQTGTFYWAHHEKLCVIDQAIAFMGGIDLCFGRWDTPQHVLVDDTEGSEQPEIWPGKDYSNPRVGDFHTLNKPTEDMYDRTKVPRMPWHDVGLQVVGQPARDLARHFVQRWNYLLRIKNHSRIMPFLLPPPEYRPGELHQLGLTGTCEMQICRSAGPWSLGTPATTEHSIQNAYLKAIQMSEHFVYIENQFFISSTTVNDVKVENKIGDAIVRRIVRAHRDKTPWKCCIVIPLLPGFTFPVDHSDASAIRIILECQNRTISRGPHSIFGRLRKEGIDPDEYISIFSLRNWAKMRGDVLTTEQVYIHGKICIVDDRLAIIGSANINERSQRGDRDSELAAVIRDTDMIDCTMGGKPFKVGRFAHTLRVRLMREHLGVDVDALDEDLMERQPVQPSFTENIWDPDAEQSFGVHEGVTHVKKRKPIGTLFRDTVANQVFHATEKNNSNNTTKAFDMGIDKTAHPDDQVLSAEKKTFTRDGQEMPGFASTDVPTLEEKTLAEHRPPLAQINISQSDAPLCTPDDDQEASSKSRIPQTDAQVDDNNMLRTPDRTDESPQTSKNGYPPPHPRTINNEEMTTVEPRTSIRRSVKTWNLTTPRPKVESNGFDDPISDAFWKNVWVASAAHNTEIYRKVFHAIPDDLVTTWKQYKEFVLHHERLNKRLNESVTPDSKVPSDEGLAAEEKSGSLEDVSTNEGQPSQKDGVNGVASTPDKESRHRRPAKGSEPFEKWERDEMERLLGQLNGHLVVFPTRFLQGEDIANNFLFNADRLMPLPIYD